MVEFKPYTGVWHTWNDRTGEEIQVPVIVMDEFYEPGDAIPAYSVEIAESVHGYTMGQRVGGIENVYPR